MADPAHSAQRPSLLSRRHLLRSAVASAAALAMPATPLSARRIDARQLRGVALAGAEFGQLVPGLHGRDYIYPGARDFEFCTQHGFNVVRLPFKWDRLQPDLAKPFDEEEWAHIARAMEAARSSGLSLILDPHNYARRRVRTDNFTADHLIGSQSVPTASFAGFWRELASRTKSQAHVIFGLMNEPADLAPDTWLAIANETLIAIRATGSQNLVLVPGVAYTGAHSWHAAGNTILSGLYDPVDHFAIEVHQYLDGDSSGRTGAAVSETIGVERIKAFEGWARDHKFKAFLGEFGAGRDDISLKALENLIGAVDQNPDVWIGWTAWAAGPWWPDDEPFRLTPSRTGDVPPQTRILSRLVHAHR